MACPSTPPCCRRPEMSALLTRRKPPRLSVRVHFARGRTANATLRRLKSLNWPAYREADRNRRTAKKISAYALSLMLGGQASRPFKLRWNCQESSFELVER